MLLFVLGRQPEIGLAELRAVFDTRIQLISREIAVFDDDDDLCTGEFKSKIANKFSQLGAVIKIAKVLPRFDYKSEKDWHEFLPGKGKITLGLSSYCPQVSSSDLAKLGNKLKKSRAKSAGSMRLVLPENHKKILNSATVFHNKLVGNSTNKLEVILVKNPKSDQIIVAQTIFIQDINSYSFRDFSRPKRDARVGMLPPKLAQTLINLARGATKTTAESHLLLDPFCGTGVVLQEAALMDLNIYGTDLEPRMLEFSRTNLDWLSAKFHREIHVKLEIGDATHHKWQPPADLIATETYLGRPYSAEPNNENLRENIANCNLILTKFLRNLHPQISRATGLCVAVPCWFVRGHYFHLPLVAKLDELGYEQTFFSTDENPLVYRRENQIVGRELLVLRKK